MKSPDIPGRFSQGLAILGSLLIGPVEGAGAGTVLAARGAEGLDVAAGAGEALRLTGTASRVGTTAGSPGLLTRLSSQLDHFHTNLTTETAAKTLPTLEIDAGRMPNIAKNIQSALDEGHPGILSRTTDNSLIRSNRAAACEGFCGPGSPDEYPFASTLQGGAGARVAGVPIGEQRIQGGVLSSFYQKYGIGEGDFFQVIVRGLE